MSRASDAPVEFPASVGSLKMAPRVGLEPTFSFPLCTYWVETSAIIGVLVLLSGLVAFAIDLFSDRN